MYRGAHGLDARPIAWIFSFWSRRQPGYCASCHGQRSVSLVAAAVGKQLGVDERVGVSFEPAQPLGQVIVRGAPVVAGLGQQEPLEQRLD
eukprot:6956500-Pyramimonas_sp.AAC.1